MHLILFIALAFLNQSLFANSETSPYISMHADDPVKWQAWSKDTIEKARKENKPLLLSVGYYSCYWCHVMQRENYKDNDVANIINQHFIPVIVDRELHPALDTRLNAFVEELIGYAGWPLHVFLTPEGYPFLGAVYLPKPRFVDWLTQVNTLWQEQSDYLAQVAKDAALSKKLTQKLTVKDITPALVKSVELAFISEVKENWDEMEGGFGVENKFPLPAILETTLELAIEKNDPELLQFIKLSLHNMAYNGLRDPIDGGFFRYTSDPSWQIPHFEKMLYDNAALAQLYLVAGEKLDSREFISIGLQTLDFMIENMQIEKSGFASSFSAVSESGKEGEYYLWQHDELKSLLNDKEFQLVSDTWALDKPPYIEDGYLPVGKNLATSNKLLAVFNKLKQARSKRQLPRDDKLITSWNALALMAITQAIKHDQKYRRTGEQLADFLASMMQGDKLYRSMLHKKRSGTGTLEDYAYTAYALTQWSLASVSTQQQLLSKRLIDRAWKRFFNASGWQTDDQPITPYISREAMTADSPLPAPSAVLILASLLHGQKEKPQQALGLGHFIMTSAPFWYATQIRALRAAL